MVWAACTWLREQVRSGARWVPTKGQSYDVDGVGSLYLVP